MQHHLSGAFSKDEEIIRYIDSLSLDELRSYDKYCPSNLGHYLFLQRSWLQDSIYYLGIKLHRSPTEQEIVDEIEILKIALRFRAYYVNRFPELILE